MKLLVTRFGTVYFLPCKTLSLNVRTLRVEGRRVDLARLFFVLTWYYISYSRCKKLIDPEK